MTSTISATDTGRDFYYIETMPEVFLDVFILNQRFNPLLCIIYAPVEAFHVAKCIESRISRIIPQIHIAAGQTIYNVFIWLILVVWSVAFIHTRIYLRVLFPNLLISLDRRWSRGAFIAQ